MVFKSCYSLTNFVVYQVLSVSTSCADVLQALWCITPLDGGKWPSMMDHMKVATPSVLVSINS